MARPDSSYYLETSVWGMLLPGQPRALRRDSQRLLQLLRERQCRCLISQVVLDEIEETNPSDRTVLRSQVARLDPTVLALGDEAEALAQAYIHAGILPAKKDDDARHVAAATLGGADVPVSWNYRHLVRPRKAEEFRAVNLLRGYNAELEISTPAEVLHGKGKDN